MSPHLQRKLTELGSVLAGEPQNKMNKIRRSLSAALVILLSKAYRLNIAEFIVIKLKILVFLQILFVTRVRGTASSGGIRTHTSRETSALHQRLIIRPLSHATILKFSFCCLCPWEMKYVWKIIYAKFVNLWNIGALISILSLQPFKTDKHSYLVSLFTYCRTKTDSSMCKVVISQ